MEAIGELELSKLERKVSNDTRLEWKFKYKPIENASDIMYWPKGRLEDVLDEPKCGFDGLGCEKPQSGPSGEYFTLSVKKPLSIWSGIPHRIKSFVIFHQFISSMIPTSSDNVFFEVSQDLHS